MTEPVHDQNALALTQQYFTSVLGINDSSQHMLDWLRERGFVVTGPCALDGSSKLPSAFAVREIANIVNHWLEWSRRDREKCHLTIEDGTHIMALPVPSWPTHSQFKNWIAALNEAGDKLDKLDTLSTDNPGEKT